MKLIKGDLIKEALEGNFDIIIHGCNCFCTMGSGIAYTIRKRFPEAYEIDYITISGDELKLGSYSSVNIERIYKENKVKFTVVNAYTQYDFSRDKIDVNYNAVKEVFRKIKRDFSGKRIGYPMIGAGLAGGDWNIISKIIDEELEEEDHTLVIFNKE